MIALLCVIFIILIVLLVAAFIVGLQGLIYWGIGSFVCWAFSIPYTFTFSQGIAIALIVSILGGLFKGKGLLDD